MHNVWPKRVGIFFVDSLLCLVLAAPSSPTDQQTGTEQPPCSPSGTVSPICGLHNPEDVELLDDKVHLLVSELPEHFDHPARGLLVVDIRNGLSDRLAVSNQFEAGWGEATCTMPVTELGSHGIQVSMRADGRTELLVVNHAERESIEALELVRDGSVYRAIWHGCVMYKIGLFNAVALTHDGGFVVTVMLDRVAMARDDLLDVVTSGADTGYLMEWHPNGRLAALPNSAAPNNNGVQVSGDGRYIFFNAWSGRQIRKYDRDAGRVTQVLDVPFQPDNMRVRDDGRLIVAGIDELGSWKKCMVAKSHFCNTGFTVVAIDPVSMKSSLLYHGEPGLIGGASVAVQASNVIYVGSFMGDRLLKIPLRASRR